MKWIAGGEYLIEMTNGTGKWQLTIMNVSMDECVYNTLWHNLKTNEKIEQIIELYWQEAVLFRYSLHIYCEYEINQIHKQAEDSPKSRINLIAI